MALERMGLGAVLTTDSKPMVKALGQARDATGRFIAGANKVPPPLGRIGAAMARLVTRIKTMAAGMRAGMQQIGMGLRNLGMGLAPMALGLGAAVKTAASFEKQMSAVGAITQATAEDERLLGKKAKEMGILSAFSATQAGQGMEFMARAGASTQEILNGLDGVMNAAAADGIDLATSADIVSRVVRGMGMEFSDATHIADVLALASSKSNTNIRQLGESFVYGAATARQAGISLEETTALLGKMADAGLKGSLAGTGLTNMLGKITKPSGKAAAKMKEWKISLDKADGSMRKVSNIVGQFKEHIEALPTKTAQLAAAQEIFGKRGARAYGALAAAGEDATNQLEELLIASSRGEGAALRMATKRLDNLTGKLILLKSSLEGLAIEVFGPNLTRISKSIGKVTDGLNAVLLYLAELNDPLSTADDKMNAMAKGSKLVGKKNMPIIVQIALGIRDAVVAIGDAWDWFTEKIKEAGTWIGDTFGGEGLRTLSKWVVILGGIAGVLTPALLGLMMFKWVAGGLVSVFMGLGKTIMAAFWPLLILAGGLFIAFQLLKRENESFGETAVRVWGSIKAWALDVWQNVLEPMWKGIKAGFMGAWEGIKNAWKELKEALQEGFLELYQTIFGTTEQTQVDWRMVGKVIGTVVGRLIEAFITFHRYVVPVFVHITQTIIKLVQFIWEAFKTLGEFLGETMAKYHMAFKEIFSGSVLSGLKRLGVAILGFLLGPIQLVLKGIVKIAKALKLEHKLPAWALLMAKQGIEGFVYPGGKGAVGAGAARGAGLPSAERERAEKKTAMASITEWKKQNKQFQRKEFQVREKKKKKPWSGAKKDVLDEIADAVGAKAGAAGGAPRAQVDVKLEDKRVLDIRNEMCIDGEGMAVATARHTQEIQERSSFKSTPWQRRMMIEHGAATVRKAS